MPARLSLLLALLVAVSVSVPASAQSTLLASRGPISDTLSPATLTPYTGVYATPDGTIELVESPGALRLVVTGAPLAAALADLSSSSNALDTRTHDLLTSWAAGDSGPLAASVTLHRQPDAQADFTASRSALTRRLGEMTGAEIAGTFYQANGQRATLAQIHFERGSQWISLVWTDSDELATIKRGLNPIVSGTARPTGPDTFESASTTITFSRDATGRIHELAVGTSVLATR